MVKLLNEIEAICAKMNRHLKHKQLIVELFNIRDYNGRDNKCTKNFGKM
jgi:hypothetical protein